MKFGSTLKESLYSEWKYYYIDYDGLKNLIKGPEEEFTEKNEVNFVEFLEKELDKVASFQTIKLGEINRRIQHCQKNVESLAKDPTASGQQYYEVEQEINSVIPQVNELAKFSRMNYTGFIKIIKKHDKYTRYNLRPMFMVRINSKAIFKENFDNLLLQLSRLYDIVRNRGVVNNATGSLTPEGTSSTTRRTIKYWVHPDNVMELKLYVLKYLPVLVFDSNNSSNGSVEPRISTVYYDTDNFELYNDRVEKKENSHIIRFRWYGDEDSNEVFVERKVHREDWMGESNTKERFMVKHKYINDFYHGKNVLDNVFQKQRSQPNANLELIDKNESFIKEVQLAITERQLKPILRTFYNRTTFQLPGDSTVTISLDTEVAMIREDNFDSIRSGDNWRRPQIGTKYPFTNLNDHDVSLFPFAVLEVKLELESGSSTPRWVDHLINSHLVEPVPNFSKYIHGVATLLDNRVSLLPFWLPQIEKNIKRPPSRNFNLTASNSRSQEGSSYYASSHSISTGSLESQNNETRIDIDGQRNRFPKSRANDERSPLINRSNGSTSYSGQPSTSKAAAQSTSTNPFKSFFGSSQQPAASQNRTLKKRIALPVRVEPKVFFANERTFLSWLNFTLVLGSLALGLLNFGDRIGQISGLIFTLISIFVMVYSLYIYQWRAEMIRNREGGPYDDRTGPIVLVAVIFTAVVINFWLRFSQILSETPSGKLF